MRIKNRPIEDFIYIIACCFSLGSIWIARIVITKAIRKALSNDEE